MYTYIYICIYIYIYIYMCMCVCVCMCVSVCVHVCVYVCVSMRTMNIIRHIIWAYRCLVNTSSVFRLYNIVCMITSRVSLTYQM